MRVSFGEKFSTDLIEEEVLIFAKSLKNSLKFKKVFFCKDLSLTIVESKKLIKIRNDENKKLNAMHAQAKTANFLYGIRNDTVSSNI